VDEGVDEAAWRGSFRASGNENPEKTPIGRGATGVFPSGLEEAEAKVESS
jgi:hypothetical protein